MPEVADKKPKTMCAAEDGCACDLARQGGKRIPPSCPYRVVQDAHGNVKAALHFKPTPFDASRRGDPTYEANHGMPTVAGTAGPIPGVGPDITSGENAQ